MDTLTATFESQGLPAQRRDASGRARVDWRSIIALAAPFAANSALQMILSLTDTWFIGRISVPALAAMASIHWPILVFITLFSGAAWGGQTIVAQAFGGGRRKRAAQAAWIAVWMALLVTPAFALVSLCGKSLLKPFGLDAEVESLALEFWQPRMMGAPLAVGLWGVLSFFNGIGQPRTTLLVDLLVLIVNAVFAQLFIFELGWGIEGAAWATNCAQLLGFAVAFAIFVGKKNDQMFHSRLMWRPRKQRLWSQLKLGFPMGLIFTADILGFALFQLMIVHLSPIDGAASQVVFTLTSISFMPAVGIAIAGSTLVGQCIGMNDHLWARKIGNAVILMCVAYMGCIGVLLGLSSPWLIAAFVPQTDAQASDVVRLGVSLMWIAAAYQLFDGLNMGSAFCLRGAGDAVMPAKLVIVLVWLLFVPLAHMLSFGPGAGWVDWLPQYGLGAVGGWLAALSYIVILSVVLALRWRSSAWERIRLR